MPGRPLPPSAIDNRVRRPLSRYLATRVAAVNWSHGAFYTAAEAGRILEALEIRFTAPIRSATIRPGVVDVWVIEGGSGRHADIYNRDGTPEAATEPWTDRLIFRQGSDESVQDGDRVLITVRTQFLLDRCGRPVDGENAGGRVPILAEGDLAREPADDPLAFSLGPPGGCGSRWPVGGPPSPTFESWFFIKKNGGTR